MKILKKVLRKLLFLGLINLAVFILCVVFMVSADINYKPTRAFDVWCLITFIPFFGIVAILDKGYIILYSIKRKLRKLKGIIINDFSSPNSSHFMLMILLCILIIIYKNLI